MRCHTLRLWVAVVAAFSASTPVVSQDTTSSAPSANTAATLTTKEQGIGNLPADIVVINPKCVAVEVSVRQDVGVKVACRDAGTSITPLTSKVGRYVVVLTRQGSKVAVGACDNMNLRFLYVTSLLRLWNTTERDCWTMLAQRIW
ncbi:hypothetical protein PINS_up014376 [Pythium insidiosum]|nr:hypothetical protein PINS_up014376 [Pythium insidiosum]